MCYNGSNLRSHYDMPQYLSEIESWRSIAVVAVVLVVVVVVVVVVAGQSNQPHPYPTVCSPRKYKLVATTLCNIHVKPSAAQSIQNNFLDTPPEVQKETQA